MMGSPRATVLSDGTGEDARARQLIANGGATARAERAGFELTWLFWSALLLGVLRYADYDDFSESPGSGGSVIKYALFAVLLALLTVMALRSRNWRLGLNAPTVFLLFTFFACVPLLFQLARGTSPESYSSAFCTTLIYSMAAFYDADSKAIDFDKLQRRLVLWLLLLGLMYLGEVVLRRAAPGRFHASEGPDGDATNQLKSAAVLIGIYLTTLSGKFKLAGCLFAVLVAFLALRPTSTVVFCLALCVPIIYLIRHRRYRVAEFICYAILIGLAIFPFLIYNFDSVSDLIRSTEGFVKKDTLGGVSNTDTRLTIFQLAFERWQASSLPFGDMFTGGTTVYLGGWWLSFTKTGLIPIHSDFVIMLVESGLVGYVAFNLAFAWIIGSHFHWLRRQSLCKGSLNAQAAMVAIAVPVTMTLAVISSANPYLQYYGLLLVIWFVLFCSEICKVARADLRGERRGTRSGLAWRAAAARGPRSRRKS